MNEQDIIQRATTLLAGVMDPEIPVLSVIDLGIVREVSMVEETDRIRIVITPTYSGCPAMGTIAMNIRMTMMENGFTNPEIREVLLPAWTTAWMTPQGREKLKAYGIAAPVKQLQDRVARLFEEVAVACPQCDSTHTHLISEFGSTACKSLYRCLDCQEPFDYFKCH